MIFTSKQCRHRLDRTKGNWDRPYMGDWIPG